MKSQLRDTGVALKSEIKTLARACFPVAALDNKLLHDGSRNDETTVFLEAPKTQFDATAGNIVKFDIRGNLCILSRS